MKYRHPNDKRIVICAIAMALCLAAFIAVILRICLAAGAPRILFLVFILAPIGFFLSLGFLIRFCIERAKDKRDGVVQDRPVFVISKAEKICIAVIVVSLIAFIISIVFICYPKIAPPAVTAILFLASIAVFTMASIWSRILFMKKRNEINKAKYMPKSSDEDKKD